MIRKLSDSLLFIWLGLIWFLSSLPAESLPIIDMLNFDKLAHFSIYFMLSALALINQRKGMLSRMSKWDVLFLICTLAALEEAHQYFITNRQVSALDLSANLVGIFGGYFIITKLIFRPRRSARNTKPQ